MTATLTPPGLATVASTLRRDRHRLTAAEIRDTLGAYLHAYWLRPENAYWMTLRHVALSECSLMGPSADISCGDGLFSFLHAGGRLAPSFDVFTATGNLQQVTQQHADMFDVVHDTYQPPITREPDWRYDVGTDLKTSMLQKAARLNFYATHVQADNNQALPFEDECFQTVHCNSAYWVTAIDEFLGELHRVTRCSGTIVLHVKLADMSRYTLEPLRSVLGDNVLDILGRGRLACWPTLASQSDWERRFNKAGLRIQSSMPLARAAHAHIWDIGLRPIAPLLVRMTQSLNADTRDAIKRDWIALFMDLCEPLCDPDFEAFPCDGEPAEVQYVLRRR